MMNMKKACLFAATAGYAAAQEASMAALIEFYAAKDDYLFDLNFYRRTLLFMQQDTGNTDSECITTFDDFIDLMN